MTDIYNFTNGTVANADEVNVNFNIALSKTRICSGLLLNSGTQWTYQNGEDTKTTDSDDTTFWLGSYVADNVTQGAYVSLNLPYISFYNSVYAKFDYYSELQNGRAVKVILSASGPSGLSAISTLSLASDVPLVTFNRGVDLGSIHHKIDKLLIQLSGNNCNLSGTLILYDWGVR